MGGGRGPSRLPWANETRRSGDKGRRKRVNWEVNGKAWINTITGVAHRSAVREDRETGLVQPPLCLSSKLYAADTRPRLPRPSSLLCFPLRLSLTPLSSFSLLDSYRQDSGWVSKLGPRGKRGQIWRRVTSCCRFCYRERERGGLRFQRHERPRNVTRLTLNPRLESRSAQPIWINALQNFLRFFYQTFFFLTRFFILCCSLDTFLLHFILCVRILGEFFFF